MPDSNESNSSIAPAAAFSALPLQKMIADPLVATVQAQEQSAKASLTFIQGLMDNVGSKEAPKLKPVTTEFSTAITATDDNGNISKKEVEISAPLLSLVPVPNLEIKELTTKFRFEVSHVRREKTTTAGKLEGSASAQGIVSKFVDFSLSGSVATDKVNSEVANQSGVLDITVRAEQAAVPAGLQKVLDILSQSVTTTSVDDG